MNKIDELENKILELNDEVQTKDKKYISTCIICGRRTYNEHPIFYHICSDECRELESLNKIKLLETSQRLCGERNRMRGYPQCVALMNRCGCNG